MSAHPSSELIPPITLTTRLPVDLVLRQPLAKLFVDDREMEGHCNPVMEKNGNALRMNVNVSVNAQRVS